MRTTFRFILAIVLVAAGVACAAGVWAEETAEATTIAVLQFKNLCGDAKLDWLGYGFAESLSTKLSNVTGIQLVERNKLAEAMKELKLQSTAVIDPKTAGKLGKIVGAKYVIVGSFQKAGSSIKADARRVEVATSIASNGVDSKGKFDDVFEVQTELALKLCETFGMKISEAVKQEVSKPETKSMSAYELNAKGMKESDAQNWDEALSYFSQAIEEDANYVEAYYNRGGTRFVKGDYEKAFADLNKAVKLDPTNSMAYIMRGLCYAASKDIEHAFADLNKAVSVAPKDYKPYAARSMVYLAMQDFQDAFKDLNKVISINPNLGAVYVGRSACYLMMGNMEKARADAEKGRSLGAVIPPELEQALGSGIAPQGDGTWTDGGDTE